MFETVAFFNLIDTNEDAKRLFDDLLSNLNCVYINYELPTYQPMHRPDYFATIDFIIVSVIRKCKTSKPRTYFEAII